MSLGFVCLANKIDDSLNASLRLKLLYPTRSYAASVDMRPPIMYLLCIYIYIYIHHLPASLSTFRRTLRETSSSCSTVSCTRRYPCFMGIQSKKTNQYMIPIKPIDHAKATWDCMLTCQRRFTCTGRGRYPIRDTFVNVKSRRRWYHGHHSKEDVRQEKADYDRLPRPDQP